MVSRYFHGVMCKNIDISRSGMENRETAVPAMRPPGGWQAMDHGRWVLRMEKVEGANAMNDESGYIPDPGVLLEMARMRMPFGKYKGRLLIDLPEPYVVWLSRKGLPKGHLGDMLGMLYEIKVNGLEYLFKPLRKE